MRRFTCISDISIMNSIIIKKGDVVEEGATISSSDNGISLKLDSKILDDKNLFEEILKIEIDVKLLDEVEEEQERDWILQLKLKCSRKKLREVEIFLKQNLEKLL